MKSVYDSIITGLNEAIEDTQLLLTALYWGQNCYFLRANDAKFSRIQKN